jgi:hypothetical protein
VADDKDVITLSKTIPDSASGVISLSEIRDPIVRQGLDYWLSRKGTRSYPARSDIAPRDISALLRHVVLLRLIKNGLDFEYRVMGDAHASALGFSMQGQRVSDVDKFSPGYGQVLLRLYRRAVRKRHVFAFRGWMERGQENRKYIYSESVFMPLGPDENTIDHVFNIGVYVPLDSFDALR